MSKPGSSTTTHGGRRAGAGRPKSGKKLGGPHRARPPLSSKHPVHATLRTVRNVPNLRQRWFYEALRRVLLNFLEGDDFRIAHLSIQKNHLHLLVEAAGSRALQRGMQRLTIHVARAINAALGRHGKVFGFRYTASQIKTNQYAWNALSYVLNNWRRHHEDDAPFKGRLDRYSSAISFPGWTVRFAKPKDYDPLPVSRPRTALLRDGWQHFGLIPPDTCPGYA